MDKVIIDEVEFSAKAAITDVEQSTGLMFQTWPPPVMFFPYKKADVRRFWMKNTPSPLDILFCKGGKVIAIHKGQPMSTAMIGPDTYSDLVVELPAGTVEKNSFHVGSSVQVKYSTESAAKFVLTTVL